LLLRSPCQTNSAFRIHLVTAGEQESSEKEAKAKQAKADHKMKKNQAPAGFDGCHLVRVGDRPLRRTKEPGMPFLFN